MTLPSVEISRIGFCFELGVFPLGRASSGRDRDWDLGEFPLNYAYQLETEIVALLVTKYSSENAYQDRSVPLNTTSNMGTREERPRIILTPVLWETKLLF